MKHATQTLISLPRYCSRKHCSNWKDWAFWFYWNKRHVTVVESITSRCFLRLFGIEFGIDEWDITAARERYFGPSGVRVERITW
jgi:hypothetical protein